jgi:DNA modification methylase
MSLATFIQASAHDMPQVATGSVQCIVTSPPYYGLRKYEGVQDVDWPAVEYAPMPGLAPLTVPPMRSPLGNEPTIEAYIAHLVLCLREWRRVLRDDGVCFVNLGDSYVSGNSEQVIQTKDRGRNTARSVTNFYSRPKSDLPAKNLMMVPARFALAAQADGWWLRSDIIGAKVAPMPESVTDRPTRSHEHIWMLTKAAKYFWDAEAVREKALDSSVARMRRGVSETNKLIDGAPGQVPHTVHQARSNDPDREVSTSRQMRDVIEWRPKPFPGAHFAVWPEAIPERCIRAATSERGACSAKVKKLKLRQDLTDEERGKAIAYLKAKGLI